MGFWAFCRWLLFGAFWSGCGFGGFGVLWDFFGLVGGVSGGLLEEALCVTNEGGDTLEDGVLVSVGEEERVPEQGGGVNDGVEVQYLSY